MSAVRCIFSQNFRMTPSFFDQTNPICIIKQNYINYKQINGNLQFIIYSIIQPSQMGRETFQSSASISNDPTQHAANKALPQVFFQKDQKDQKDYIYVGKSGGSAFSNKTEPFIKMLPFCLFMTIKKPYILYFMTNVIIQYFTFGLPSSDLINAVVQSSLIVLCIFMEITMKYRTYLNYKDKSDEQQQKLYKIWNAQEGYWEKIYENQLKVGQILMIEKFLQGNNKLNPANLLPVAISSNKKYIEIKTTKIDKKEQYTKIKLLKPLRNLVKQTQNQHFQFKDIFFQLQIHYRFMSQLGSTFEAVLYLKNNPQKQFLISQQDIIPCGIPISTEQYVIGIVLKPSENDLTKKIKNELSQSNKINQIQNKYLFMIIILDISILVIVAVVNVLMTVYHQQHAVFILSIVLQDIDTESLIHPDVIKRLFRNTVYISMYILIIVDRTINNWNMKKKHKVLLKNCIKSFDQISQTNTLIMDDYFFLLDKISNIEDFQVVLNQESPLSDQLYLFIRIIEESPLLKEYMSGHTIPIAKYFRLKKIKRQFQKRGKIKILKEVSIDKDCIQIKIKIIHSFSQEYYLIRFNDKPIQSTIRKIQNPSVKSKLQELVGKYRMSNELLLFIEIMKTQMDVLNGSNQSFQFYGAISFLEEITTNLSFVKSPKIIAKFNMVILTNKTWKYINYYMQRSSMREINDRIIVLEQKQQKEMYNIITNHLKTIKDEKAFNFSNRQQTILFLDSSMITYLSRTKIRKLLYKLTSDCKYVVFYNCSQYQKQICAVNLFKIFPDHIYMSNFISDQKIFQYSNISVSQIGSSSQHLTTLLVDHFKNLQIVLLQQSIKSVQTVNCIVNSHIFKNQLIVISIIMCFLLTFRGNSVDTAIQFVNQINFFYNFVFTILPIIYLILKRPEMYIDEDVKHYINAKDILSINIKAIIFGCSITFLIYGFISEEYVGNLQTSVLINCVFSANIFVLFLDHSLNKGGQIIVIIIQLLLSLCLIVLVQLFNWQQNFLFIKIGTNFDKENIWFFMTTFLVMPVLCFLIQFSVSASRQIIAESSLSENEMHDSVSQTREQTEQIIENELNNTQIVLKISKSKGKQIYFQQFQ